MPTETPEQVLEAVVEGINTGNMLKALQRKAAAMGFQLSPLAAR
jgi:hypothetical protein